METSSIRFQDIFRLGLQKTSSRSLDQDKYIHLSHTSSEDVFKTSLSRQIYSSWSYVFNSRRLQDVYKNLQDLFKTSSKNVFKTSSRGLTKISSRHLQDFLKTYHQVKLFLLTRLQDVFKMYSTRF